MNWKQLPVSVELASGFQSDSAVFPLLPRNKSEQTRSEPQVALLAGSEKTSARAALKRTYDLFFAAVGLLLLAPLFLLLAIVIKLVDGGSVIYRQKRIGQNGAPFFILKFRTMVPNADKIGPPLTGDGDKRITGFGRILRRTKLDELPQLWNVLRGEMSLVGPRPEVPRYVQHYTPEQRAILQLKPGITDLASLRFRNEEALLHASEDAERFYVDQCLPRKSQLNRDYARRSNLLTDTWIILQTLCPYWVGVLCLYGILLTAAFGFSASLALNFTFAGGIWRQLALQAPLVIALELGCLLIRRHCHGLLCYFGLAELRQLGVGLGLAASLLVGLSFVNKILVPPLNLLLINLCVSVLFLSGFRLLLRLWRQRAEVNPDSAPAKRVAIVGAGRLGAHLARYLNAEKGFGRTAVAFFDDDFSKWQKLIHEVPVVGMPECLLQGWRERLDEVAIAMPDATPQRLQEISQLFQKANLPVYTVAWPVFSTTAAQEQT